jgi:ATP-binding cassette subfamily B protein
MFDRLRGRHELAFFRALTRANRPLGTAWWGLLLLRGALPAAFAVAMGALVGAVQAGDPLGVPLAVVGVVFVLVQVLVPLHVAISANLGDSLAAWLNDRLAEASVEPPGMGHLEDPDLTGDLTVARDFDLGMSGPPLSISLDFIAGGLVQAVAGLASAVVLFGFAWWAPAALVVPWAATHWLLRESGVWKDRQTEEVREAKRHADYAYRLAVDPPPAKELRVFGLADWVLDRFVARRRQLFDLQHQATRLRQRPVAWSLLLVGVANVAVLWALADAAADGRLSLEEVVTYAQVAVGVSAIAFGGLNWALDDAAAPVAAVLRLRPAMASAGALAAGPPGPHPTEPGPHPTGVPSADVAVPRPQPAGLPGREVRFRHVTFGYPTSPAPVLDGFDLTIPAGTSLAIVGQNGAGKTTLAKLLCRLYDPSAGAVEVDGVDLRSFDIDAWRGRVTAIFQDFLRLELPLRDNVAPGGGVPDAAILAALEQAGAAGLADLDTPLARGYAGGTDLSGGQWQRVALARALCAVDRGAGVVLLDEPTAQLDVRGEARVFDRILAATRGCTTILVSHRFSTVRHVDRICVLEHGRVVELGTHDELIAAGGRYRTMFDLQAKRFDEGEGDDGEPLAGLGALDGLDGLADLDGEVDRDALSR